jgi:hypothetical protein
MVTQIQSWPLGHARRLEDAAELGAAEYCPAASSQLPTVYTNKSGS